ncbi:hypothetical protein NUM3379_38060 [Kineococcus sp. NUM-3379]
MPDEPTPRVRCAAPASALPARGGALLLAALTGAATTGAGVLVALAAGTPATTGTQLTGTPLTGALPLAVLGGLLLVHLALAAVAVRYVLGAAGRQADGRSGPAGEHGGDLFTAMLAASPDAFVATDTTGTVTHWNPAAEQMLGFRAAEAVGRDLAELIVPEELREAHRRGMARFAATGERSLTARTLELPALHRDGRRLTVEMSLSTLAVGDGWWCHAFLRDVSGRREQQNALEALNTMLSSAEAEARQQSALLGAVMNSISDGVVVVDENGSPLLHNDAARAVLDPAGTCEDPALWLEGYRVLHPDGSRFRRSETPLARAIAGESTDDVEVLLRDTGQGAETVLAVSGRPLNTSAGLHGAVAVFHDVTERRRTRVRLEQAETRWRLALDNAPVGIVLTALDGTFLHSNEALRRILGYSEEELRTRTWQDITHPEDVEGEVGLVEHLVAGNVDDYALQKRYLHAGGYTVWVEAAVALVRDEHGEPQHLVGHVQDITRQRYVEEQLRSQAAVFDAIHDAVLIISADGTLLDCNPAMADMTGLPREVLLLGGCDAGVGLEDPATQEARRRAVNLHLESHPLWTGDFLFRRADGATRIAECVTVAVRDVTGALDRTISVLRDVTDAREAADELREAEQRFRHAFDRSPVGMVLTDLTPGREGRVLRVNDSYCAMLGRSEADLLTMSVQQLTHPDDLQREEEAREQLLSEGAGSVTYEKRYLHATGRVVWVSVSTAVVTHSDGTPYYAVTQTADITDRHAETERLAALALQDPLTGLGNRVLLMDHLELAVNRARRSRRPLAVLFCDLNGFKPVNDTYGHAAGDELLRVIGTRIRESVRPADTVCRLGGDEFVILCEDLDSPAAADSITGRIRAAVSSPVALHSGEEVRVGVSIGLSLSDCATTTAAELLEQADAQMYRVKAESKVPGLR